MQREFNKAFFERYLEKNILGIEKGKKWFLYSFWMRKLKTLIPEGRRVLEVGCGIGYFLKWLEKRYEVTGLDISKDAIEIAKKVTKATLVVGNAEDLPFKENHFSAVIAFDVIEHLPSPEKFFKEAFRVLSPKGLFIITTPNPDSFGCRVKLKKSEGKNLPYNQRALEWYGWRDTTHINIKSVIEWRKILAENGFLILKDGTDTLWDVPYFRIIPTIIQKLLFIPVHYGLSWLLGILPWEYGENYICIAQKK